MNIPELMKFNPFFNVNLIGTEKRTRALLMCVCSLYKKLQRRSENRIDQLIDHRQW